LTRRIPQTTRQPTLHIMSLTKTLNALAPYWDLFSDKPFNFNPDDMIDLVRDLLGAEGFDPEGRGELREKAQSAYDRSVKKLDKSISKTDPCLDYCVVQMSEPVRYGNKYITKKTIVPGPVITYRDILKACAVFVDNNTAMIKEIKLDSKERLPTFYVTFV